VLQQASQDFTCCTLGMQKLVALVLEPSLTLLLELLLPELVALVLEPSLTLLLEPLLPELVPAQSATCCRPTSGISSHQEGGAPLLLVPVLPVPPQSVTYFWLAAGMSLHHDGSELVAPLLLETVLPELVPLVPAQSATCCRPASGM